MSEIFQEGFSAQSLGNGFVQLCKSRSGITALPVHLTADQVTIHFERGVSCEFFYPVSTCQRYIVVIKRAN